MIKYYSWYLTERCGQRGVGRTYGHGMSVEESERLRILPSCPEAKRSDVVGQQRVRTPGWVDRDAVPVDGRGVDQVRALVDGSPTGGNDTTRQGCRVLDRTVMVLT